MPRRRRRREAREKKWWLWGESCRLRLVWRTDRLDGSVWNLYDLAVVRGDSPWYYVHRTSPCFDTETSFDVWARNILKRTHNSLKKRVPTTGEVDVRRRPLTTPNLFQEAVTTRRSSAIGSRSRSIVNFPIRLRSDTM